MEQFVHILFTHAFVVAEAWGERTDINLNKFRKYKIVLEELKGDPPVYLFSFLRKKVYYGLFQSLRLISSSGNHHENPNILL